MKLTESTKKPDCLETPYVPSPNGYAYKKHEGKLILHHRLVYCEYNKVALESIKGLDVRHTCDHRKCINPLHLVIGTRQDNVNDMMERGRGYSPPALLTEEQVTAIRAAGNSRFSPSHRFLAKEFGVSQPLIGRVLNKLGAYK